MKPSNPSSPADSRDTLAATIAKLPVDHRTESSAAGESRVLRLLRRMFTAWGRSGAVLIVTACTLVVSLITTALTQSAMQIEGPMFRMGMGIATVVPLLVAPPVVLVVNLLIEHLLMLEARLSEQALRDALTGLPNRRWIMQHGEDSVKAARLSGTPFGVLILDVDFFKSFNDRYGHPFGDHVLREIAGELARRLSSTDRLGRYGGEEFLLITADRDVESLRARADMFCQSLARLPIRFDRHNLTVTVSIGAALHVNDSRQPGLHVTLQRADDALYRAKSNGRNRVEMAMPSVTAAKASMPSAKPAPAAAKASMSTTAGPAAASATPSTAIAQFD